MGQAQGPAGGGGLRLAGFLEQSGQEPLEKSQESLLEERGRDR